MNKEKLEELKKDFEEIVRAVDKSIEKLKELVKSLEP